MMLEAKNVRFAVQAGIPEHMCSGEEHSLTHTRQTHTHSHFTLVDAAGKEAGSAQDDGTRARIARVTPQHSLRVLFLLIPQR